MTTLRRVLFTTLACMCMATSEVQAQDTTPYTGPVSNEVATATYLIIKQIETQGILQAGQQWVFDALTKAGTSTSLIKDSMKRSAEKMAELMADLAELGETTATFMMIFVMPPDLMNYIYGTTAPTMSTNMEGPTYDASGSSGGTGGGAGWGSGYTPFGGYDYTGECPSESGEGDGTGGYGGGGGTGGTHGTDGEGPSPEIGTGDTSSGTSGTGDGTSNGTGANSCVPEMPILDFLNKVDAMEYGYEGVLDMLEWSGYLAQAAQAIGVATPYFVIDFHGEASITVFDGEMFLWTSEEGWFRYDILESAEFTLMDGACVAL